MTMILDELPIKVRVIPPLTVTQAVLIASTVNEPDSAISAWSAATNYGSGDIVSYNLHRWSSLSAGNFNNIPGNGEDGDFWEDLGLNTAETAYSAATTYAAGTVIVYGHRRYISLAGSNTNHTPDTSTSWWEDIGPSNKFAMFDLLTNAPTVATSPLQVTLTPGERVSAIALTGLVADSVQIQVYTPGSPLTEVYDSGVIDLSARAVTDWTGFFFNGFHTNQVVARFDIPQYSNGIIEINVLRASGDVEVGACVIGRGETIGNCERSPRLSGLNFSSVTRNFAGGINTMVPRRSIPKASMRVFLDAARVNRVMLLRELLNAEPAFWCGIDDDEHEYFLSLQMVGFYRTFDMDLYDSELAILELELESI